MKVQSLHLPSWVTMQMRMYFCTCASLAWSLRVWTHIPFIPTKWAAVGACWIIQISILFSPNLRCLSVSHLSIACPCCLLSTARLCCLLCTAQCSLHLCSHLSSPALAGFWGRIHGCRMFVNCQANSPPSSSCTLNTAGPLALSALSGPPRLNVPDILSP